jgi:D-galactose 1-dehydrogenase
VTTTDPRGGGRIGVGVIGLGKIAQDQHLPALRSSPAFALVAGADPLERPPGLDCFADMGAMLAAHPAIQAVAVCTPPLMRHGLARAAILAGKHVLLEKPPCATLGEVEELRALAAAAGVTVFAAWHSRFAASVEAARLWLAPRGIAQATITWKENARQWHPGQQWLWDAGGMGVFDPGINALSILTLLCPEPVFVRSAVLSFPANQQTPIAAELALETASGARIDADFDFRQLGGQTWDIAARTRSGERMLLSRGGDALVAPGAEAAPPGGIPGEYAGVYARFAELVAAGVSDLDEGPLRMVADAMLVGDRRTVEAFHDP